MSWEYHLSSTESAVIELGHTIEAALKQRGFERKENGQVIEFFYEGESEFCLGVRGDTLTVTMISPKANDVGPGVILEALAQIDGAFRITD